MWETHPSDLRRRMKQWLGDYSQPWNSPQEFLIGMFGSNKIPESLDSCWNRRDVLSIQNLNEKQAQGGSEYREQNKQDCALISF